MTFFWNYWENRSLIFQKRFLLSNLIFVVLDFCWLLFTFIRKLFLLSLNSFSIQDTWQWILADVQIPGKPCLVLSLKLVKLQYSWDVQWKQFTVSVCMGWLHAGDTIVTCKTMMPRYPQPFIVLSSRRLWLIWSHVSHNWSLRQFRVCHKMYDKWNLPIIQYSDQREQHQTAVWVKQQFANLGTTKFQTEAWIHLLWLSWGKQNL